MKKRTKEEIDRQITGLENMKNTLPETSMFGDKNWEKIDAQIAVLKGESESDDFHVDESSEDYRDGDNDLWSDTDRAERWLDGEEY